MAIDTHDFVIPEQQYGGLYKVADTLGRERQRKDDAAKLGAAKKASMATFLNNYIDPKDYFTGTVHDPHISDRMNEILTKGAELAQQDGVDANMLTVALSPMVTKLGKESQNLKELERQRKDSEGSLKGISGISMDKFNQEFKKAAYYNPDGSLKDIASIDPTHNYTNDVLTNGDVYNADAINDYVKDAGKNVTSDKFKIKGSNGGSSFSDVEITKPDFYVQDKDVNGNHIGFVPKFNLAADDDQPLLHNFMSENGNKTEAPIRVLSDDVFYNMRKEKPEAMAYILQETKKYAQQHKIDPSSPQAENLAKALAYDMLNNVSSKHATYKTSKAQVQPPAPRTSITVNTGNSGGNVPTVDVFQEIFDKAGAEDRVKRGVGYAASGLSGTAQKIVIDYLKNLTGDKNLSQADFYIKRDANDNVFAVGATDNKIIAPINAFDINTIANRDLNKTWSSKAEEKSARDINLKGGEKVATQKPTAQIKMVTMVLPDGRKGQIPESEVANFLKDNPKAKKQ